MFFLLDHIQVADKFVFITTYCKYTILRISLPGLSEIIYKIKIFSRIYNAQ